MPLLAIDTYGQAIPVMGMGSIQNLTISGSAATSTATASKVLRLSTDGDAWVLISDAGTAATSTTGFFLPANSVEYFKGSGASKVSIIQKGSATGTVNLMECA
jgi:hypothetical protein